jgi:hypothetical protein
MNIKDQFLSLGSLKLRDGKQIRFWEDKWLGAHALRDESIQHLFFDCALAKFIWRVVYLVSRLVPPNNIRHMSGAWGYVMNSSSGQIFLVGIGAMLWAIWLSRNDMAFNKVVVSSSMQVIFRGTNWTITWVNFQKESKRKRLRTRCRLIKIITMKIFARHEWWSTSRLSL